MKRRILKLSGLGLEIEPVIEVTVTRKGSSFIYGNPKHFYFKVIKENLKEFYKDETNERKAINACITLYHMADWHCPNKEERKKIWAEIPYSAALESIANGTKHFNTEKPYQAGKKEGTHLPKKLIVSNGEHIIECKHILETVEKFWDSKIGKEPWDLNWGQ